MQGAAEQPAGDDAAAPSAPDAVTTKIRVRAGAEVPFAHWQARFTRTIAGSAGFVSVDFLPVLADARDWRIVQHFRSAAQLEQWRAAAARTSLMADLAPLGEDGHVAEEEPAADFHAQSGVTEVITTMVKPGREAAFLAWSEGIQAAQGSFPGYRGTYVQAPLSAQQPYWTALVRYAAPERLEAWLESGVRRALLDRSGPLVEAWEHHRLPTSFAGWFPPGASRSASAPFKQAALVLLPVVMLELRFLSPLLAGLNGAFATFLGNAISVGLVTWPLMPLAIRGLGWWLRPKASWRTEIRGLGALVLLYAVEIAALWTLL
jgi:antibiotic biosynthesis monooxygenase (ABM) superfamily enzyme